MHKLDRSTVTQPPCLVNPPTGPKPYKKLHGPQRKEIRDALFQMQGHRCAYCERRTGTGENDGHIEHFLDQSGHPEALSVDWNNMFWSCLDEESCGKFKDKCDRPSGPQGKFDAADLLKPCTDNPDDYLLFLGDGGVRPKDGLDAAATKRAKETLRVFRLADHPYLRKSREDAVLPYFRAVEQFLGDSRGTAKAYIASSLGTCIGVPFETAIRHFLESVKPA